MEQSVNDGVSAAGDILINELTIISYDGHEIDLQPFLVELNLIEEIFSTCLYGNIMISDARGLIEKLPLIGEEYIRIDIKTPGTDFNITKTFRVYHISDRIMVNTDKSQSFTLHFCSPELFADALNKIHKTFEGRIDNVAETIYKNYLMTARNIKVDKDSNKFIESEDSTDMTILSESQNNVKFTSPGWGPIKCLSWLAAKAIPKDKKIADCLFFETCKNFYWGSISSIFDEYKTRKEVVAEYIYSPTNVNIRKPGEAVSVDGVQYKVPDVQRDYKILQDFTILDSFNTLRDTQTGFYASQLITIDLLNKKFEYNDFDYIESYKDGSHLNKFAPFSKTQFRTPLSHVTVGFVHPNLYTGFADNVNEMIAKTKQARLSYIQGLSSMVVSGTVPGRTDMECGSVVAFSFPSLQPKSIEDSTGILDPQLSGLYLLTCIRHKITSLKHNMIIEMVKDSDQQQKD